ncbi:MAG: hypothetical protein KJ697_02495 [Nanoarchaeota archaeon]|nr:hypothetical protein [Nanoarchaeota archaeon]MBU4124405.1 hypothetical protein [Nanoarchaeota archaeon]
MKIVIKKKKNGTGILISFSTQGENFKSVSERSKFFEKLHGRKQIIIRQKKKYEYHRLGVLDEVPHIPVDNSVFIIMQEHMKQMEEFFNQWEDKVMFKTFPVLLDKEEAEQLQEVPVQPEEKSRFKLIEVPKKKKVI